MRVRLARRVPLDWKRWRADARCGRHKGLVELAHVGGDRVLEADGLAIGDEQQRRTRQQARDEPQHRPDEAARARGAAHNGRGVPPTRVHEAALRLARANARGRPTRGRTEGGGLVHQTLALQRAGRDVARHMIGGIVHVVRFAQDGASAPAVSQDAEGSPVPRDDHMGGGVDPQARMGAGADLEVEARLLAARLLEHLIEFLHQERKACPRRLTLAVERVETVRFRRAHVADHIREPPLTRLGGFAGRFHHLPTRPLVGGSFIVRLP